MSGSNRQREDGTMNESNRRQEDRTMSEGNRTGDAVLGFVIGAVLGAGAALLLAPSKGKDMRRRIGNTARRLGEGVTDGIDDVKDKAIRRASEINGDVKDAIDAGLAAAAGK